MTNQFSLLTLMSEKSSPPFKPSFPGSTVLIADRDKIQDIIDYGDSRFRQALLVIAQANLSARAWMQRYLQIEVVSVDSHHKDLID